MHQGRDYSFPRAVTRGLAKAAKYTVRIARALNKKNAPQKREHRTGPNDVLQRT